MDSVTAGSVVALMFSHILPVVAVIQSLKSFREMPSGWKVLFVPGTEGSHVLTACVRSCDFPFFWFSWPSIDFVFGVSHSLKLVRERPSRWYYHFLHFQVQVNRGTAKDRSLFLIKATRKCEPVPGNWKTPVLKTEHGAYAASMQCRQNGKKMSR